MESKNIQKLDEDLLSFLSESREIIEDIEPKLVELGNRLENNLQPDGDTVNHIFRGFHTIKGTAAFYQLDEVVSVAHKAETLLEFFRNGKEDINASCTDVLCQVCDVLEVLFQGIEAGERSESIDEKVRSIIFRLNGRIDLFRKKLDDKGVEKETDGSDDDDFQITTRKREKDEGQVKPGKHIRIFAAESSVIMNNLSGLYFMRPENTVKDIFVDDVNQAQEWLEIISDSASFLGADDYIPLIEHIRTLLKQLSDDDLKNDGILKNFRDQCDMLIAMLDSVESRGIESYRISDVPEKTGLTDTYSNDTAGYDSVSMESLFFKEASGLISDVESMLAGLVSEPYNRRLQSSMHSAFHKLKGSAGMMNQSDLEYLSMKTEHIMEDVLDDSVFLDSWDLKAIWHVVSAMKICIAGFSEGKNAGIVNKPALVYILEQIKSGKDVREKEVEINLTEIIIENKLEKIGGSLNNKTDVFSSSGSEYQTLPASPSESHTGEKKTVEIQEKKYPANFSGAEKKTSDRRDIRVNTEKLDELINLVGELVIAENMVINNPDIQGLGLESFEKASAHLRKIVRDLQDVALAVRMVPISGVFRKMIRLVHDLSAKSGKKVALKLIGEDTEIDKTVSELISDPLVHLIRNAIDHGIESTKDRKEDGLIILEACHEGGEVMIILKDNGKGLDTDRIYEKALEMGIVTSTKNSMTVEEIHELIFHPGFSTCEDVTDFSGRGVGLDVVKMNLEKIKGRINVFSKKGRGTVFVMRIPLTLAIIDGMLIRVGRSCYTVPLLSIRESLQVKMSQVTMTMDGQEMINLRGELIPVIRLHRLYHIEADHTDLDNGLIVVIEHRNETAGLFIDEIVGEQQTVIKGLSTYIDHVQGISGCTILGDGEVSLILDVGGLIKKAQYDEA